MITLGVQPFPLHGSAGCDAWKAAPWFRSPGRRRCSGYGGRLA